MVRLIGYGTPPILGLEAVPEMSTEAVQAVLERTVTDSAFRARLLTQPDDALAEYELTSSESGALRQLCLDAGQSESAALDRRETKKVLPFWLSGGL